MTITPQTDSRISDATTFWQEACGVDAIDWDQRDPFILATYVLDDRTMGGAERAAYKLQWRRAGGTFADVSGTSEIKWAGANDTVLIDDLSPAGSLAGCLTVGDSIENEGNNLVDTNDFKIPPGEYGEIQWGLTFSSEVKGNQVYEFQLVCTSYSTQAITSCSLTILPMPIPLSNVGDSRQVFRNPRGNNRSYKFFIDGDDLKYQWYNDASWSTSINIFTSGRVTALDIKIYDTGSLLDVYVILIDYTNADLTYIKGTISDASNTISFNSPQDIDASLNTDDLSASSVGIARTDNGRLVVAFSEYDGTTDDEFRWIGSDGDGASPSWSGETGSTINVGRIPTLAGTDNSIVKARWVGIEAFSSTYPNRVLIYYYYQTGITPGYQLEVTDWAGSSFSQQATDTRTTNSPGLAASAVIDNEDKVHIVACSDASNCWHLKYPTVGGLGTESQTSVVFLNDEQICSMTIDRANDEIYVFYKEQGESVNFHYKKSATGTISFGSEQTIVIAVDIKGISTAEMEQDGKLLIVSSPEV